MLDTETFYEMGAPYTGIEHPIWPPRAPTVLSPRVLQAARDLDRALDLYAREAA